MQVQICRSYLAGTVSTGTENDTEHKRPNRPHCLSTALVWSPAKLTARLHPRDLRSQPFTEVQTLIEGTRLPLSLRRGLDGSIILSRGILSRDHGT